MRVVSDPAPETAPKLTLLRIVLLAAAALTAPVVLAFRPGTGSCRSRCRPLPARDRAPDRNRPASRASHGARVAAARGGGNSRGGHLGRGDPSGRCGDRAHLRRRDVRRRDALLETPQGSVLVASAGEEAPEQLAQTGFPLVIRGERRGMLDVRSAAELKIEDSHALETLAAQVALALETVARAREQAERASEARDSARWCRTRRT